MAAQVLYPRNDLMIDDKAGRVYRIMEVYVPSTDNNHELEVGERGIETCVQISGPGTLAFTVPAGTGTSPIDSGDDSRRVEIDTTSVAGLYRVCVVHVGRNAAAL